MTTWLCNVRRSYQRTRRQLRLECAASYPFGELANGSADALSRPHQRSGHRETRSARPSRLVQYVRALLYSTSSSMRSDASLILANNHIVITDQQEVNSDGLSEAVGSQRVGRSASWALIACCFVFLLRNLNARTPFNSTTLSSLLFTTFTILSLLLYIYR